MNFPNRLQKFEISVKFIKVSKNKFPLKFKIAIISSTIPPSQVHLIFQLPNTPSNDNKNQLKQRPFLISKRIFLRKFDLQQQQQKKLTQLCCQRRCVRKEGSSARWKMAKKKSSITRVAIISQRNCKCSSKIDEREPFVQLSCGNWLLWSRLMLRILLTSAFVAEVNAKTGWNSFAASDFMH